ncbi:nucleoid-associated protein [Teredinibacter haidensis]|uniref:nucleoid-associated protein n=1 Tax=Teredinibacter haidensis TaxID=2731755 RepID=UPI0009489B4E|nr:nucleoid-associated protein [Teredinibacter haidensis]
MEIQQSIIHGIIKDKDTSGADSVTIKPRIELLSIDDRLITLGNDILKLYGKLSNGYGMLGDNYDVHRFPKFLDSYIGSEEDFIVFSNNTISVISELMSQQRFSTTSYPVFFRYTNQGNDWLLIAVLKLKEGVGIDEETLDLNDSLSFDVSDLREAARIDIEKWKVNQQPYLSFIKRGSGSDSESSRYFRDALSCLEYTDAKYNTDTAVKAVDDYCNSQNYDAQKKQSLRARMYEYCKEKKDADEPVNLTSLSAMLNDQEPESFINFVRENNYEVSETFSPSPASYKRLQRLSKRFGTISLGFDVDDLYSERVVYNSEDNSIVLRNPPTELVTEIKRAKGESENGNE